MGAMQFVPTSFYHSIRVVVSRIVSFHSLFHINSTSSNAGKLYEALRLFTPNCTAEVMRRT